jgi:putative membrane protein
MTMRINRSSRIALPFAALLALAPLSALAQGGAGEARGGEAATGERLDAPAYVSRATQDNLAQIRLAELALKQATSPEVKELARFLRAEHLLLNDSLELAVKEVDRAEGLSLPKKPDAAHEEAFRRLSRLRGAEFDRAYLDEVESAQQAIISLYEQAAGAEIDFDLRAYASTTLPALGAHLSKLRDIRGRLSR